MKRSTLCIALALGFLPALLLAAGSWWNNDWKYRKELAFDASPTGANLGATASEVPMLVRLSLANFSYFNDTKPDGSDFRLIGGDDKTPLKFHFEKYDPQNQMALLWVRVPQISAASKTDKIYAYYGNPAAPAGQDVAGTYDTSQVLVLPFGETNGVPQDATAYKNNPSNSTAELTAASLIGGGAKFTGKELISVPATASLRLLPSQGITFSSWVRVEQGQKASLMALADGGSNLELAVDGARFVANARLNGKSATVGQSADVALGKWHHVAMTATAGKLTLYVDGTPIGSQPLELAELGGELKIGNGLTGEIDEVEVAKSARSADWIKAAAASQAMDGNIVLFGADGQKEGGGQTSYFVTIAKNLTVDGWVVIGICIAMLITALIIMFVKALFLSRVERANNRFLAAFRRLHGDLAALDSKTDDDEEDLDAPDSMHSFDTKSEYGASTLYRLYHHGLVELRKRTEGKAAGAARVTQLSPQSIDAIRAVMDASLTRLQQSLSSQMVMLTIAISGGPFLGLLGTVIGVMITFAAIALSGDVNVNAIAPGTAAALAATVAGLSVAIPALFGYNWLNTRIKAITADNRVFVDEYVTRVAEQYS